MSADIDRSVLVLETALVVIVEVIGGGGGSALCSPVPMFPGSYVPRYLCSLNLCSPVPMFPDLCTLTVDFSINR